MSEGKMFVAQIHSEPSAVCLVCGGYQFEDSTIINPNIPYLCDRCRAALLKIVESEEAPDGKRTDR